MQQVIIKNKDAKERELIATFTPEMGMNMLSFKLGDIELIDLSTKALFEERFAGLGALIGPHFHRKKKEVVPQVEQAALFPHIARVKSKGIHDPFSHGIARYAPWTATATETKVCATLKGKDLWQGVLLSQLEGQDFTMSFTAEMLSKGLHITFSITSATDSLIGLHYYWRLPQGRGEVISEVQKMCLIDGLSSDVPIAFQQGHRLHFDALNQEADHTFFPAPDPCAGVILLKTAEYTLKTSFISPSQECSWQLYHPKGASFICIEPISAQDPRHPNLSVSSLDVLLEVE